jgi:hypothetical protein
VSQNPDSAEPKEDVKFYFSLTFFGSQSFFFVDDTKPHSLHRQSPGFALRIGFPFWQLICGTRAS